MRDYYALLGIQPGAPQAEIRTAYRRQALDSHPDRHPGDPGAEERFKAIAEAYSVLSDADLRRRYDEARGSHQDAKTTETASTTWTSGFDYEAAAQMFMAEMFRIAFELTMRNLHWTRIAPELEGRGCPSHIAQQIAQEVERRRKAYVRAGARKLVLRGLLSAIGGAILTGVLWELGYVAALGPLLVLNGLYNFARALWFMTSGRVPAAEFSRPEVA